MSEPDTGQTPADPSRDRGILFVVSAPSGAGKTTLCSRLMRRFPQLSYSISHTTRSPRRGERDGRDYFFTTPAEFEAGIRDHRWAEWAQVHDHYYGTARDTVLRCLEAGRPLLLDIDVQGARQIRETFPSAVTIFIMPPAMEELARRLTVRGTDDEAVIARRLENADQEMAASGEYRHVVINDDLETAAEQLISIVDRYLEGCR